MGKALYGRGKAADGRRARRKRLPVHADEYDTGWLTLRAAEIGSKEEAIRDKKVADSLECMYGTLVHGLSGAIAAAIIEYGIDRSACDEETWSKIVSEAMEEAGAPVPLDLSGVEEDDDASGPTAMELVDSFRTAGVLVPLPPPLPPPCEGDPVYAVLAEDGEWYASPSSPCKG